MSRASGNRRRGSPVAVRRERRSGTTSLQRRAGDQLGTYHPPLQVSDRGRTRSEASDAPAEESPSFARRARWLLALRRARTLSATSVARSDVEHPRVDGARRATSTEATRSQTPVAPTATDPTARGATRYEARSAACRRGRARTEALRARNGARCGPTTRPRCSVATTVLGGRRASIGGECARTGAVHSEHNGTALGADPQSGPRCEGRAVG
jgi:hypothetical protein